MEKLFNRYLRSSFPKSFYISYTSCLNMEVELKEWGNSVGVILPAERLKELGLHKGDKVDIEFIAKRKTDGFGICRGATKICGKMIYIVDSYAWVEYFIGSEKGEILNRLFQDNKNNFFTIECCLAELKGWSLRNNHNFGRLFKVIRANSTILKITEYNWVEAAEERFEQRKKQKDFGLIDAVILVKQKERNCKVISGDKHFKRLKNIVYLG